MKITQKQVSAFSRICDKNSSRMYPKLVSYNSEQEKWVATNGRALLCLTPIQVPENEPQGLYSQSYLFAEVEVEAKIAKLTDDGLALVDLQKLEKEYNVPPYSGAIPSRPQKVGSFGIKDLIDLLEGLKRASFAKTPVVGIYFESDERPLLLKLEEGSEEDFGVIVPLRIKN